MANIYEVKSAITGKARANRFRVILPTPTGTVDEVLVKASSMPGRAVGVIEVKNSGATVKIGGDPTYNDWDVTMYAENYEEYRKMFYWMELSADYTTNTRGNPNLYKMNDVRVEQLGPLNEVVQTVILNGVWITSVENITFDNESSDTLVEFSVTFSIDDIIVA